MFKASKQWLNAIMNIYCSKPFHFYIFSIDKLSTRKLFTVCADVSIHVDMCKSIVTELTENNNDVHTM